MSYKDKFEQFHSDNPHVWELFKKYTMDAVNAGYKSYGVASIFERIRWHSDIETTGDTFKINNNHKAFYARMFMDEYPKHSGFFRTRIQKAK